MQSRSAPPLPAQRTAAFWLGLCFALAQWITMLAPWMPSHASDMVVCSASGGFHSDGASSDGSDALGVASLHCALCLPALLPLPQEGAHGALRQAQNPVPLWVAAGHFLQVATPLPPLRGPPALV